ncbi:alpha/beta hydrolase [Paenibacillus graminis]|uniref:Alpha/beta hydrolase n=1 Tax=Paenibacillus graminis TaxID=189425 RepID=A0A089NM41_9BACL|nr:alpha/beta hydrolase [Paenibacillus graminis]AIQ70129.1 alpha/beta hydrolase [Paenibacillus graminis]
MKRKEEGTDKRMGKPLRIILKTIGAIAALIVLFMAIVFTVNIISNKSELGKIKPYGQLVPVDGKKMNVLIQGSGDETIVLLPGAGTPAPGLDFKPLIDELSPFYKMVVVEPFGYGLSDETDKERSTENIVSEVHEALQQLNIKRYVLMGHSIAGIYSLSYVNKYPNEVIAFAGIDSSVPTQGGMDAELPLKTLAFLQKSGLLRLVNSLNDPYASSAFDDQTKEQMLMLANKVGNNATLLNEMKHISSNFREAQKLKFPETFPVILLVQADNKGVKNWIPLHEEQAKESKYGKVMTLEGGHYLHHTRSKEIAENFRKYMDEIKK